MPHFDFLNPEVRYPSMKQFFYKKINLLYLKIIFVAANATVCFFHFVLLSQCHVLLQKVMMIYI